MDRKKNSDVLMECLVLKGRVVVDVGCGDGALVRLMTRAGAVVTGVETSPGQLGRARAASPVGDEVYVLASAEDLPMGDGSADIVVFANSLHHVPVDRQARALAEAARVVTPGGIVYVSEPVAEGPFFEVTRIIDDETGVRAAALRAIKAAGSAGLVEEREIFHINTVRHPDYEFFRQRMVAIDEDRARLVAERDGLLRAKFAAAGRQTAEGWEFDSPMRVNLLRRV